MVFLIMDSGNDEGYGKPFAVAYNREQVERYISKNALSRFSSKYEVEEVILDGKIEKPYGWREEAYCVEAQGHKNGERVIGTRYEVYRVMDVGEKNAFSILDFFGE